MGNHNRIYRTGFWDHHFEIHCNNDDVYSLAELLFADFPGAQRGARTKRYAICASGDVPVYSFRDGDKNLYSGGSRYWLAFLLVNRVMFDCIDSNNSHHVLHAGAVCDSARCILFPAKSGSGKSMLTGWLATRGYCYLTDEIVFLEPDGTVLPMTRPVDVKISPDHHSWFLQGHPDGVISGDAGSMIPPRLLNSLSPPPRPRVRSIIFPHFVADAEFTLDEITPARSSLNLLYSHLNARNLGKRVAPEISSITRRCRSFRLTYGNFDQLSQIFYANSKLFE
ncbi:MAG: hypothetical protein N839_0003695 [Desulfofustis sp. PB-SRB1]|jgi:hypothetical protein|nr:hypothetical protein [Desulfofustis sp. PB-SRB1]MBM1001496.1 hypothetical protein [Desulfofustis sp. PB-SRB1]HBH29218.1 hypothetical protein [Desulfofustis sp.]